ncbi:MAG: hypothetical protein FWG35_01850 [Spirochaetaceae bacterium]|nr:hypothetical protein [Spirochaetaceae bacterium]
MGKKISIFYCIFSIAFFAALLLLFFARLGEIKKANTERVSAGFDQVRRVVETTYIRQESFDSLYFKDMVRKFFSLDKDLDLIMVYSYDTGIEYLRARDSRYLPATADIASIRGRAPLSYSNFSRTRIASSITVPRKSSFIIEGVYRILHEREIFIVLRDTFLILLVFSIITAALAFLLRLVNEGAPSGKTAIPLPPPPQRREAVKPQGPSGTVTLKITPAGTQEKSTGKKSSLSGQEKSVPEKALLSLKTPSPAEKTEVPVSSLEAVLAEKAALETPEWRSLLEKRLTLELERSAYNEQDLTLLILKIPEMVRESDDYRYLSREIQSKLSFEDLTFEYPPNSFAVILPNSNLDQSLGTLKNFLKTAEAGFTGRYEEPLCGLTSRSGRLMDGPGLLREGEAALEKIESEKSNTIIGFRPDPAKYRAYIAEQGPPVEDTRGETAR